MLVLGSNRLRTEPDRVLQEVLRFLGLPKPPSSPPPPPDHGDVDDDGDDDDDDGDRSALHTALTAEGRRRASSELVDGSSGVDEDKYLSPVLLKEALKKHFPSK